MQSETPFRVPESLSEAIAEHLGLAIAEGRLRPGQRLVEAQLCEEFAVSRTPLREALRRLSAEGDLSALADQMLQTVSDSGGGGAGRTVGRLGRLALLLLAIRREVRQ